jgi:anti-sigma regulatory factor (Ser/Thr protein kinase)
MYEITRTELAVWINSLKTIANGKCPYPQFLKPFHFITLALAIKKARWEQVNLPDKLQHYAARMQFWETLDMKSPKIVNKNPTEGKFLPLQVFNKNKKNVSDVVIQLIKLINKNASTEYRESLSICLQEIVNNFFDHANASNDLPCLIAAQSWPKSNLVQIAIADAGIGIRSSLAGNMELHQQLSLENACKMASQYGVTSKPNAGHSGYGLALAKGLMEKSGGKYILYSGNEIFTCKQGMTKSETLGCIWDGTLLILEWQINQDLNITSVYNSWPISSGFNEDDFF